MAEGCRAMLAAKDGMSSRTVALRRNRYCLCQALASALASPVRASTMDSGRLRAPRFVVRVCVVACASEGVIIRNECI
eukprot:2554951-Pleurochrysis_carterae.AAC.1